MPDVSSSTPQDGLSKILSDAELTTLRTAYAEAESQTFIHDTLRNALPNIYGESRAYVDAVTTIFYGPLPDEDDKNRPALSVQDRERCLIALLAARGEEFNLGLHIYMALMEGVTPAEVAHIILLTGVYTGVDNFSIGLNTLAKTLVLLKNSAHGKSPDEHDRQPPKPRPDPATMKMAGPVFAALRATLR